MIKTTLHILLLLLVNEIHVGQWELSVREIAVLQLNDIAMASIDAYGPVIYYNPNIVAQADPDFVTFTKEHEYAHIYLKHINKTIFLNDPYYTGWIKKKLEKEADLYAVKRLIDRPETIEAAISIFNSMGNYSDGLHPSGKQRAKYISDYFKKIKKTETSKSKREQMINKCLQEKIERCMETCQDKFDYSYHQCRDLCKLDEANLEVWLPECEAEIDEVLNTD